MHPIIHELALAATPRRQRHVHAPRPGHRVRHARRLVAVGSVVVRIGVRLRDAGADRAGQVLGVRHQSGAPPGARTV